VTVLVRFGALVLMVVLAGCESTSVRDAPPVRDKRERAQLQTQLGVGYLREGQTDQAYQRLTAAVDIDPTYAPGHNALGLLYERLRQSDKAGAHYARATVLDPSLAAARNNYGGWLCRRERYAEAIEQFEQAAANPLYEAPELTLYNAALCVERRGDTDAATEYLRRSLERNPKFPQALLKMSELSLAASNPLSARGYLQRYLEVGSHGPTSLWLGIRIERELGDKNAVSSYAMLLKSKFPDAPETKKLLASEGR